MPHTPTHSRSCHPSSRSLEPSEIFWNCEGLHIFSPDKSWYFWGLLPSQLGSDVVFCLLVALKNCIFLRVLCIFYHLYFMAHFAKVLNPTHLSPALSLSLQA